MRPTPLPPNLLRHPFTLAQARAAGLNEGVLRGARFRRLFRGVYASVDLAEGPGLLIEGAFLIAPAGSFAVHTTAAYLYGLPDVTRTHTPRIGLPPGVVKPRTRGIEWYPYRRAPSLTVVAGRPVTDPVSTFLDCAARLPLLEAVVIGDALVRRQLVTCEQLVTAAARVRGRPRAAGVGGRSLRTPARRLADGDPAAVADRAGRPARAADQRGRKGAVRTVAGASGPVVAAGQGVAGVRRHPPLRRSARPAAALGQPPTSRDARRRLGGDRGDERGPAGEPWRLLERIRRVLAERGLPGVPARLRREWREVAR